MCVKRIQFVECPSVWVCLIFPPYRFRLIVLAVVVILFERCVLPGDHGALCQFYLMTDVMRVTERLRICSRLNRLSIPNSTCSTCIVVLRKIIEKIWYCC